MANTRPLSGRDDSAIANNSNDKPTAELNQDSPTLMGNSAIILRSGFAAPTNVMFTDGQKENFFDYDFQRNSHDWAADPSRRMVEPGVFSREIERLTQEFTGNPDVARDLDWLAGWLNTVNGCFGGHGESPYTWMSLQLNNPYIGSIHYRFLQEWFGYVQKGSRSQSIHGYRRVLRKAPHHDPGYNARDILDKYFMRSFDRPLPKTMVDFLLMSFSYPDGMADSIYTMWLIFGEGTDKRIG